MLLFCLLYWLLGGTEPIACYWNLFDVQMWQMVLSLGQMLLTTLYLYWPDVMPIFCMVLDGTEPCWATGCHHAFIMAMFIDVKLLI